MPDTPDPRDAPTTDGQAPIPEPQLPRGCNPLTFGVVMATIEMAVLLGLWLRCR